MVNADQIPLGGLLNPLVAAVARTRASVHTKLLAGFLVGALLILAMGVLNLLILARMSDRVAELTRLHEKVDWARRMEYQVTAQSHFRAMALLTRDDSNNDKITSAKRTFLEGLDALERLSPPSSSPSTGGSVRLTIGSRHRGSGRWRSIRREISRTR